jgi:alpha-tubulin suppressor-like RCC1 family protein
MWGDNFHGHLGNGAQGAAAARSSPVSVLGSHSFTDLDTGGTAIGLKADGSAWCWGFGQDGGCGDGTANSRSSPVSVIGGHSFVKIASSDHICFGLKEDDTLWSWGANQNGLGAGSSGGFLGDNTTFDRSSPILVLGGHEFIDVECGLKNIIALKENGEVWSWGLNQVVSGPDGGQLGTGDTSTRSSPVSVLGFSGSSVASRAKSLADVVAGDKLYWNGIFAGFDLASSIRVDLLYRE